DWRGHWSAPGAAGRADFFDAKGLAERLLDRWIAPEALTWRPLASDAFAAGAAAIAETDAGVPIGVVGLVSRAEREKRKLPEPAFAGEIRVDAIPPRSEQTRF